MGDASGAEFAANIFGELTRGYDKQPEAVQKDRRLLAERVKGLCRGLDFNDDDLGCYEELFVLGLAKRCKNCDEPYTPWSEDYHGDGECVE